MYSYKRRYNDLFNTKGLPPKTAFTIMEKVRKGLTRRHGAPLLMGEHVMPDWCDEVPLKTKSMFPKKGHAVAYVMMWVRIVYFKSLCIQSISCYLFFQ